MGATRIAPARGKVRGRQSHEKQHDGSEHEGCQIESSDTEE